MDIDSGLLYLFSGNFIAPFILSELGDLSVIKARAIWLAPGLDHPVYKRFADFFCELFEHFEALDYRAIYLKEGQVALERQIESWVKKWKPQLALFSQFPNSYSYLTPEFLARLRKCTTVTGFGFDDEIYFEQAKWFYQSCSAVITTDIAGSEWLKQLGIPAYLAQMQQPQPKRAAPPVLEDIPVSFVGDMSKPGRRKYVEHLQSHGIPVLEFGLSSRGGKITDSQVFDVFSRSKINLNFTGTNPPKWILREDPLRVRFGQIKGRPFELAEMGKFCLCEWSPCVDYWFQSDVEIGVFRNPDDLVCQVRRFLNDDSLRHRIITSCRERYESDLAPTVQFTRLFNAILSQKTNLVLGAVMTSSRVFYYSMGRSRGIAMLYALCRMSPLRAMQECFSPWSTHKGYWKGLFDAVIETLKYRLFKL